MLIVFTDKKFGKQLEDFGLPLCIYAWGLTPGILCII